MTKTSRACAYGFFFFWLFVVVLNKSYSIHFTKSKYSLMYSGRRCIPNETIFEMHNVSEIIQCGKVCLTTNGCRSVFYQPTDRGCVGCRARLGFCDNKFMNFSDSLAFDMPIGAEKKELETYSDCKDILSTMSSPKNGIYDITLRYSKTKIKVYCDMETDGGGWTVFQNRFDGSVDFYRNFYEYENGFGDIDGEFWLGMLNCLKYVQEMTSFTREECLSELRISLIGSESEKAYELYTNFYLGYGPDYRIYLTPGKESTVQRKEFSLYDQNGVVFSTFDRDQDQSVSKCAVNYHGAWWYSDCARQNLNGEYITPGTAHTYINKGHFYHSFQSFLALKGSRMMFRRM
ncbi:angiopoietin-2-like [Ruditapes philippinarum]|uniref:angiopoietin-2-like n=1 Tax=Ruditapes philippinarum TaxID=129788 RepID=UPI00295BE2BD|nr:angiopoietin-2-like [Ruditapes philippinarum]